MFHISLNLPCLFIPSSPLPRDMGAYYKGVGMFLWVFEECFEAGLEESAQSVKAEGSTLEREAHCDMMFLSGAASAVLNTNVQEILFIQ